MLNRFNTKGFCVKYVQHKKEIKYNIVLKLILNYLSARHITLETWRIVRLKSVQFLQSITQCKRPKHNHDAQLRIVV